MGDLDDLQGGKLEDWDRISQKVSEKRLIELTEGIYECPEGYDGPCYCQMCVSYGG